MLGQDVMAALRAAGETVLGTRRSSLDITSAVAVDAIVSEYRPDIVVNCAAWTAVDAAEADAQSAMTTNGLGTENLARACAQVGAVMAHISTDYVFDGRARRPYAEDARPGPRTAYGRSKLAGEVAVLGLLPDTGLVIRTAWLYGRSGPSFVHTMIRLAGAQPTVDVVDDQRGQPTWTADVAGQVIALATVRATGIYHATSGGDTTWFGLAREIFTLLGTDPQRVRPACSEAFPRPAPRPAYSVLGHDRHRHADLQPIGPWQLALRRAWPTLSVDQGSLGPRPIRHSSSPRR
jgi:dTDP-4-dehydrorhamnose reductase